MSIKVNRQERGVTLVEVLVAVLVLSIGLLGMAALQATSLRQNHGAFLRSQATLRAYDILDRMRANKSAALAGRYNRAIGSTAPTQVCTSQCNSTQMASADIKEWIDALGDIPQGDGSIAVTNAGIATVSVAWYERHETDQANSVNAANQINFQLTTQL